MKALIYTQYGPPEVLHFEEIEKPQPKEGEVLVKVQAVGINAADWHLLTADIFLIRVMGQGFFKPKQAILGSDMAGRVEAPGEKVERFQPGDEVFGDVFAAGKGAFGEYIAVPERILAPKPANLTFAEAAAVPIAALTALQGLRDMGQIQPGQKTLIQGASGGVGTFAVQLAKYYGTEVTAVCSTRNIEQARLLGADHVIDYTREDFTKNGQQYDLILAANGYHPISAYKRALSPTGRYVMAGGKPGQLFQAMLLGPLLSEKNGRKLGGLSAKSKLEDLLFLKELLEAGKISPVIDRCYPFSQAPDALRYLGEGHARGKVVITMES